MSRDDAHRLVEEAYELIEKKLDQDEITQDDIEECQAALQRAQDHEDAGFWVTLVTEGEINDLEHQRYPDGDYQWEPFTTNRECLEDVAEPNRVEVNVK